jgi:hypothetical protein
MARSSLNVRDQVSYPYKPTKRSDVLYFNLYAVRGRSMTGASFPPSLFGFSLLITIPPLLHTHISPPPEVRDDPNQAAHYHILGLLSLGLHRELRWSHSNKEYHLLGLHGVISQKMILFINTAMKTSNPTHSNKVCTWGSAKFPHTVLNLLPWTPPGRFPGGGGTQIFCVSTYVSAV